MYASYFLSPRLHLSPLSLSPLALPRLARSTFETLGATEKIILFVCFSTVYHLGCISHLSLSVLRKKSSFCLYVSHFGCHLAFLFVFTFSHLGSTSLLSLSLPAVSRLAASLLSITLAASLTSPSRCYVKNRLFVFMSLTLAAISHFFLSLRSLTLAVHLFSLSLTSCPASPRSLYFRNNSLFLSPLANCQYLPLSLFLSHSLSLAMALLSLSRASLS